MVSFALQFDEARSSHLVALVASQLEMLQWLLNDISRQGLRLTQDEDGLWCCTFSDDVPVESCSGLGSALVAALYARYGLATADGLVPVRVSR